MDYSVVILSFNSQKYIATCLQSLLDAFAHLDATYEIFVIDNGSKDQSCAHIERVKQERGANIHLIRFDHNTGTTFSRNQGLKRAAGEHVIVMDSDAYANAEAIAGLSAHLKKNAQCGLVCPRLTYPDGRFQLSTDVFPTFVRKLQRFFFLKDMEKTMVEPQGPGPFVVDYAISAFWMFPRSVMEKVGFLDERIFYSPEDVDYCIRVWKSGFEIHYLPAHAIVHDAQEISRSKGLRINFFTLSHAKGLFYLFFKHRYFFSGKKLRRSVSHAA